MLLQAIRGVLREAAMVDGGDAGGGEPAAQQRQAPQAEKLSVHDRLKAALFPQQDAGEGDDAGEIEGELPEPKAKQPPQKVPQKSQQDAADDGDDPGEGGDDDAGADTNDFTTITELAERTGLTLDRLMDLAVPARVDGKEARATIREMVKSYQTDQLLNGKLQTHASEVQAWKTQQQQEQQAYQHKLQQADAGLQVLQQALQGDFAQVNWQQLQQADPAQYAQVLLGFQQRQAQLDQIAQNIGKERQAQQSQQEEQHSKWIAEQRQLLEAKMPEWADQAKREAAIKELVDVLGKEVGFTAEDFSRLTDHRDFMVANMALQWLKLKNSKAEVLNKVRKAPQILRPGATQSNEARRGAAITESKAQLRKSGNVRDAAKALISGGFV